MVSDVMCLFFTQTRSGIAMTDWHPVAESPLS